MEAPPRAADSSDTTQRDAACGDESSRTLLRAAWIARRAFVSRSRAVVQASRARICARRGQTVPRKAAGFAAVFEGLNPYRAGDEALRTKTAEQPLLRIRPAGMGSEPFDPSGLAWVAWLVVTIMVAVALVAILR
jgi:hypothetical protein